MASIRRKDRSPFWFACYTLPDGRRTQRSTGARKKAEAQRIANEYEDAAKEASAGRFVESRARRAIADIYRIANQEELTSSETGDFLTVWLKGKESCGDKTHAKYASVIKQFKGYIGAKTRMDITHIVAKDIAKFRDRLASNTTAGTANVAIKILRSAFGSAFRDGLVDVNEADRVELIKDRSRFERKPFTLDELKKVLAVANDEWRGMILFGLYTGQRLGDVANLTFANVDLTAPKLTLKTIKTGRTQDIPLHPVLVKYIENLKVSDDPAAPLFPKIHDTAQRHQHAGNLSNAFYNILVSAGLAVKKSHKADPEKPKGRSAKREQNSLSFHSLRHTATSLFKNAGVGEAIAMDIIGHESKSVSRQYTHISPEAKREAVNNLPDVTK